MQIRELDLSTLEWRKVDAKGNPPPYKTHTSAAVLADKWILHGGRKAGKFNVTNDTFTFDFKSLRQAVSLSPLSLSWQTQSGRCFPYLSNQNYICFTTNAKYDIMDTSIIEQGMSTTVLKTAPSHNSS